MKKTTVLYSIIFIILFVLSGCEPTDSTPPIITLNGSATISLEVGVAYQELGAICQDDVDTVCDVSIDGSTLDINQIGTYQIMYSSVDSANNESISISRTVYVVDNTSPVIKLTGSSIIRHEVSEEYIELGATCTDNYDMSCSVDIDPSLVQFDVIGSYEIIYTATDSSSNEASQILRTVIVEDTTRPTIELVGDSTITINVFDEYHDLGATCTDNFDVNCTVVIDESNIDTNVVGEYIVLYTATDSSGNNSTQTLRTVYVVDNISPTIELLGQTTLYVSLDDNYLDLGAICSDNYDSECYVSVDSSNLDTSILGTYFVTYTSTDSSNNVSLETTRTIIVQDTQNRAPWLSTNDVVYHLINQPWTNPTIYVPHEGDYSATRQGSVDESVEGVYYINYTVTDELDNIYKLRLTVFVVTVYPDNQLFLDLENIYNFHPFVYSNLRNFDTNNDLFIDTNEAEIITHLDFSGENIKNFDFLPNFVNLENLNVDENNLYDIDFVVDLPHLETLSASGNNLGSSDVCVISSSNIKELDISNNFISNLDCLISLNTLEALNASNNSISSIPLLTSIDSLILLDVSGNPIESLDSLLPYINLTSLNIDNTEITDIYDIDILSKLQVIFLDEAIIDYYPIDYLFELTEVTINQLNADLEQSFFFDYLMTYGISVTTQSMTAFDLVNPNILLLEESKVITVGESFDYSTLNLIVYDYYDLYISDQLVSSIPDTSILTPGNHTITLSFTDEDGNTSFTTLEIQVLENFDLGNIVIFIRFADETDFTSPLTLEYYENLFNGSTSSLRDYYLEVSNNEYNINTILPSSGILFFTDTYSRAYYQPYDAVNNPIGYQDDDEGYYREQELLANAITWADSINLFGDEEVFDYNNDDVIDVITFLISGQVDEWSDLIWPHKYAMYSSTDSYGDFLIDAPTINGKYAYDYTFQLIGDDVAVSPYFDLSTFAHEMFHIIGSPDLYHYYSDDDIDPTGYWGLMNSTFDIPAHMLGYMKETYGNWAQDEIVAGSSGTYIINRTTLDTDNLLIIDLAYSNEFLYLEYRTQTGEYESNLPSEGLLVYRVDLDYYDDGNIYGYYDESGIAVEEVYLFRPSSFDSTIFANEGRYVIVDDGNPDNAPLSLNGHVSAGSGTSIPLFYSDGTPMDVTITVIAEDSDTVTIQITLN